MIELKTATEIDAMGQAGHIVARALRAVRAHAQPGILLRELDELARTALTDAGARPVRRAPGAIGTSVNDVITRGIPDGTRLTSGDLISIDCAASLHDWVSAAAITFSVGRPRPEDTALVRATEQSLADAIAAARPGARLGEVSRAIGVLGRSAGYGIPAGLGGGGIGRDRREAPPVPNDGHPGKGVPLRPGLVLTIEPVLLAGGTDSTSTDDNGWTVRTADGSRAAHTGHTIAITADGPRILTAH